MPCYQPSEENIRGSILDKDSPSMDSETTLKRKQIKTLLRVLQEMMSGKALIEANTIEIEDEDET